MTKQHYERLRRAFLEVLDASPDERSRALDEACEGDANLRAEVLALLDHDPGATSRLGLFELGNAARSTFSSLKDEPLPERIGPFRILGEIGRGGMGRVLRAEQERPSRAVALKILYPGTATLQTLRRFHLEAEILGRLTHPSIARIFDAGTTSPDQGSLPWFAMELIDGAPLLEHVEGRAMGVEARLELLASIAEAVHYAHEKGVIHRDLKPANILVDSHGTPRILDFGIARLQVEVPGPTRAETAMAQVLGTVPYMSPEQAGGARDSLDARSDVYSLGVILFELLLGRLPHDLSDLLPHEAVRVVQEHPAPRLGTLDPKLKGELEIIAGKALEQEVRHRYASARALAQDIRSFLAGAPISARPPSAIYYLRKFTQRHRALVLSYTTVLLVLLVGIVATGAALHDKSMAYELLNSQEKEVRRARDDAFEEVRNFQVVAELLRELTWNLGQEVGADESRILVDGIMAEPMHLALLEVEGSPRAEVEIRYLLGHYHRMAGRSKDAVEQLERALWLISRHDPANEELKEWVTLEMALAASSLGDAHEIADRIEPLLDAEANTLSPEIEVELRSHYTKALLDSGRLSEVMDQVLISQRLLSSLGRDTESFKARKVLDSFQMEIVLHCVDQILALACMQSITMDCWTGLKLTPVSVARAWRAQALFREVPEEMDRMGSTYRITGPKPTSDLVLSWANEAAGCWAIVTIPVPERRDPASLLARLLKNLENRLEKRGAGRPPLPLPRARPDDPYPVGVLTLLEAARQLRQSHEYRSARLALDSARNVLLGTPHWHHPATLAILEEQATFHSTTSPNEAGLTTYKYVAQLSEALFGRGSPRATRERIEYGYILFAAGREVLAKEAIHRAATAMLEREMGTGVDECDNTSMIVPKLLELEEHDTAITLLVRALDSCEGSTASPHERLPDLLRQARARRAPASRHPGQDAPRRVGSKPELRPR